MHGKFAVIGLGQFGSTIACALAREGQSVLAIDKDRKQVEAIAHQVDDALSLDATDEQALSDLGLGRISCAVVTLGSEAREASILATALLQQLGVPCIVARAYNELHARVLRAVGAHEVIDPETEMGERLAIRLANPAIADLIRLGDASIAQIEAPEALAGRSLADLEMRDRFKVSVLALRRGEIVKANPRASETIESGDVLVLLGHADAIKRLGSLT